METSEQITGVRAAASPSGRLIACIADSKLRVHYVQDPECATDLSIKIPARDVTAIKWSAGESFILVHSHSLIEIIDLEDDSHSIRIDNGSGGLGRFQAVEFVRSDFVLTTWEVGKAKIWDLASGKATDLGDLKSCESHSWALRPGTITTDSTTLALLSRAQAQDQLAIHFPATGQTISPASTGTADAKSLSWSPDGLWLAILDETYARPSLVIFTPDGNHFRSYPRAATNSADKTELGIKAVAWSPDYQNLALSRYDNTIVLLNTRTFSPVAIIEHSTTIDQTTMAATQQALVWQENVSASNARTYTSIPQPVSPLLSRTKPATDPNELGIAEARFSSDGRYLATRDERMLSTVWMWEMSTLSARAVLLQHNNVRRIHWHSTRSELLLVDCGESIAYLFDVSSTAAPTPLAITLPTTPIFSFLSSTTSDSKPVILAATKSTFCLLYPEGHTSEDHEAQTTGGDDGEDSLIEVLTGKKPVPARIQPSYTEMVDLEAETEDDATQLDDTFREKQRPARETSPDPLDDSQIF